jgi:DNA primase
VIFPKGSSTSTLFQWEDLKRDHVYIVEGLMDMISLRTCEATSNSTAYFGASVTHRQVYLLDKFEAITIIPDNDVAGLMTLKRLRDTPLVKKTRVAFPPSKCKDVNDILLKKNERIASISDAMSKGWLRSGVYPLSEIDIDTRMRVLEEEKRDERQRDDG